MHYKWCNCSKCNEDDVPKVKKQVSKKDIKKIEKMWDGAEI